MFRTDKLIAGIATGILFPFMFFVIFYELKDLLVEKNMIPEAAFRLQFLCIISVVANVIPAGSYVRTKMDQALKGIVGVTLVLVFSIIVYFYHGLVTG
ncbi:MAG: hypothetical protein WCI97_01340 [Bacteroidota bacterium]